MNVINLRLVSSQNAADNNAENPPNAEEIMHIDSLVSIENSFLHDEPIIKKH
jgi:hypothetical protein